MSQRPPGRVHTFRRCIPVKRKCNGEPDGRSVTGCRQVIGQCGVSDAPVVWNPVSVASSGVEVNVVRQWKKSSQSVGDGHANQHRIGRITHRPSQQNHTDHDVIDDGQQYNRRRHVTAHSYSHSAAVQQQWKHHRFFYRLVGQLHVTGICNRKHLVPCHCPCTRT